MTYFTTLIHSLLTRLDTLVEVTLLEVRGC